MAFSRSNLVSRLKKQNKDDINTKEEEEEEEENRISKYIKDEGTTKDDILELLLGDERLVYILFLIPIPSKI
jgi:hypothetical protein